MKVLQTAGQIAVHQVAANRFNAVRKGSEVKQRGVTKQSVEKRDGTERRGGKKVVTKEKIIKLNNSQQKAIRSFEKQIAEHRQKLEDYIADPDKYDHRGFLKNANTRPLHGVGFSERTFYS
jgi:predicted metallo-beta-lactamase superfamily hydrolase